MTEGPSSCSSIAAGALELKISWLLLSFFIWLAPYLCFEFPTIKTTCVPANMLVGLMLWLDKWFDRNRKDFGGLIDVVFADTAYPKFMLRRSDTFCSVKFYQ